MPGDANVTSELSDEDWLSSGSLSNIARSTSVWAVESVSIRSPASCTVTLETAVPIFRLTLTGTGIGERTSTSCFPAWKPAAFTLRW